MLNLEQFIKENREAFHTGEIPQGHKARFSEKLRKASAERKRKHVFNTMARIILSVAAVFVIAFILDNRSARIIDFLENRYTYTTNYALLMADEERQVMELMKETDPFTGKQLMTALENITFEAIPLKDQLPDELPEKQKKEIMNEYYRQKTEGIQKIKDFLIQEQNHNN